MPYHAWKCVITCGVDIPRLPEYHCFRNVALPIFEVETITSMDLDLSSNQTLLKFLLYMGQTGMTQLIMAVSFLRVCFHLIQEDFVKEEDHLGGVSRIPSGFLFIF